MHIDIAMRLKPYSSIAGTYFVLPLSPYRVQVFPTCLHVDDLSEEVVERKLTLKFRLNGPIIDFFVSQDLERCQIIVSGYCDSKKKHQGYFRYILKATKDGVVLCIEKAPHPEIAEMSVESTGIWGNETIVLKLKEEKSFGSQDKAAASIAGLERLSLGSHRKEDIQLLVRRKDFFQILPIWHLLGQIVKNHTSEKSFVQKSESLKHESFLAQIKESFKNENIEKLSDLKKLFFAGFDFAFSPRLNDEDHQGILLDRQLVSKGSPLNVLSEGFLLIRSLFIETAGSWIKILPALPSEFHSGRLLNASISQDGLSYGKMDLEWSKKEIRRVIFRAENSAEVQFEFCRKKTKCRLCTSSKDRGKEYSSGSTLKIEAGKTYFLDRFQ